MEQPWVDDDEFSEPGSEHAVGFVNLYNGEVYGECLCGWSTTLEEPDLLIVEDLVAEARSRVVRHVSAAAAGER